MLHELTVIVPEMATKLDIEELERLILTYATEIGKKEDDGVKRLAYSIQGKDKGHYLYYEINLPYGKPQELSSKLNINDTVMRYLLVRADTRVKR